MSNEHNACGLFRDRVMTAEEWKQKHGAHCGEFKTEPFRGPHDWHWLVCECGAKHLASAEAKRAEGSE